MSLLWFCLICYGFTQIVVYGSIFNRVRPTQGKLGELFSCPMCTGFWVGVILWCVSPNTELFTFDSSLITAFLLGCAGSAAGYVPNIVFGDDGIKIHKKVHIKKETVDVIKNENSMDA